MDEDTTEGLQEISDDKEESEPKSPQFTTLTTVRYDDYMHLSVATLDESDVAGKMDFDDSSQISSTTGLITYREPDVVMLQNPQTVIEAPVESSQIPVVPVNNVINISANTLNIPPVKRKYKRTKKVLDQNDISVTACSHNDVSVCAPSVESTEIVDEKVPVTTAQIKSDEMSKKEIFLSTPVVESIETNKNDVSINTSGDGSVGTSKYGRVRKQKLSADYVSLDRKSFAVLNSSSYKSVVLDVSNVTPLKLSKARNIEGSGQRKRGRPPKVSVASTTSIIEPVKIDSVDSKFFEKRQAPTAENTQVLNVDRTSEVENTKISVAEQSTIVENSDISIVEQPPVGVNNVISVIDETSNVDDSLASVLEDSQASVLNDSQISVTEDNVLDDSECSKSSTNLSAIKTYSKKSDSMPNTDDESQVSQMNLTELNWKVGDVAWAKIGSFPYWPSIVTLEYGTSIYAKNVGKKQNRLAVHVQFFGDKGRRSWVLTTSLMKYESKDQFLELKRKYRKDKIRMKFFFVLPRFKDLWDKGICEADTILKLPHNERIPYYKNLYPISEEMMAIEIANMNREKRPIIYRRKKNPGEKRGRKRKIHDDSSIEARRLIPDSEGMSSIAEGKRSRKLDDHTKTRIAFMRKMNRILKESELNLHPRKKKKNKFPGSNDPFNKLLDSKDGKIYSNSTASTLNSSPEKKNDLSVYDFESDDDTDVFIGTYNSKFTPQILSRIEAKAAEVDTACSTDIDNDVAVLTDDEASLSALQDSANDESVDESTIKDENIPSVTHGPTKIGGKKRGRKKKLKPADNATPLKRKRGRPRKIRPAEVNDVGADGREKTQNGKEVEKPKRLEQLSKDTFEDFRSHVMEKLRNDHPEWSDGEKERLISKMWTDLEVSQRPSRWYSVYDSSSDEEGYERPRSPSPQVSSARMKKLWNIFAGYKVDKVCQICLKTGDTVKCRGPCSGHYHLACAQKDDGSSESKKPVPQRGRRRSTKNLIAIIPNVSACKDDVKSSELAELNCDATTSASDSSTVLENTNVDSNDDAMTERMNSEATPKEFKNNGDTKDESTRSRVSKNAIDYENGGTTSAVAPDNDSVTSSNIVDLAENPSDEKERSETECSVMDVDIVNIGKEGSIKGNGDCKETAENEISSSTSLNERFVTIKTSSEETSKLTNKCSTVGKTETDAANGDDQSSGKSEVDFRCRRCSENRLYPCFVCGMDVQDKTDEILRYSCNLASCGRVYHKECLKIWPQTTWINGSSKESLKCPQHFCHTCISENPVVLKNRQCNENVVKCVKCPASYHKRVHCIPAGTEIITSSQIICPRHYEPPQGIRHAHFNTSWCFICCVGGSLICCDECPTSFHADCLKLCPEEYEGRYICDDCQSGRLLLYGEIAWVKLGHYRWWPAKILFPHEVPDNLLNLPHRQGEFVVEFFGSHNFNWINRGRAFAYQEGDSGKKSCRRSSVDMTFEKAMTEAEEAYKKSLVDKAARDEESRVGMKPPRYAKIRVNKPVGNVRIVELNSSSQTPCECDPNAERPCAPDSDCLNRMLMVECNPSVCPAGERCLNQAFEKREYPLLMPYKTRRRGWGLKTLVEIKKGAFIIEYVGEMIDEEEYKKRVTIMHENQEDNYYFLTIDKDRMLDAGPKGNVARFMNHSCDPNCETQKWTVNGDTRIGLFALKDIPAHTELVFNYNLATQGEVKRPCYCGAENCSGYIGVKALKNGNGNGSGNGSGQGDEDQRKKSNEYYQGKLVNGRLMKRSRKRRLPGAIMKRAATKRATDIRIRKQLDEMKRKRRVVHRAATNVETKLSNDLDNVESKDDKGADENNQAEGNTDEESRASNSEVKVALKSKNKLRRRVAGSRIQFRNSLSLDKRVRRSKQNLDSSQPLEASFMKSNTPVGQYVNHLVEALYKSSDTYIKKADEKAPAPPPPQPLEDQPKIERRGRKKRPKTEEGLQKLVYQIIKSKIEKKLSTLALPRIDNKCFECKTEGELLFCDNNECPRGYHLPCVKRNSWPTGRWLCPWHYCNICQSKRRILRCNQCVNAFCNVHYADNIFEEPDESNTCAKHKSADAVEGKMKLILPKPTIRRSLPRKIIEIAEKPNHGSGGKITKRMLIKQKIAVHTGGSEYIEQIIIVEKPNSSDELNNMPAPSVEEKKLLSSNASRVLNVNQTNGPAMMPSCTKVSQTARKSINSSTSCDPDEDESTKSYGSDTVVRENGLGKESSNEHDNSSNDQEISDDDYTNWEVEVVNDDVEATNDNVEVVQEIEDENVDADATE